MCVVGKGEVREGRSEGFQLHEHTRTAIPTVTQMMKYNVISASVGLGCIMCQCILINFAMVEMAV